MDKVLPLLLLTLWASGCRGPTVLACAELTASLNDDSSIDVLWSECNDGIVRQVYCEPAAPRYACECYLDDDLARENSFSDDIEQALRSGDRDAIRASSNAVCAYGLNPAADF